MNCASRPAVSPSDIADLLHRLSFAHIQLDQALNKEAHSFWLPGIDAMESDDDRAVSLLRVSEHRERLQQISTTLCDIEYTDGQEGRETKKLKGVVLVGDESLQAATTVNALRGELTEALRAYTRTLNARIPVHQAVNESPRIRDALHFLGIGRLCLNQLRRQLPIIEKPPLRISWLRETTSSITTLTLEQAAAALAKLSSEQARIDEGKLGTLRPGTRIARVQAGTARHKANVFHRVVEEGVLTTRNSQIFAAIPIICATGHEAPKLHPGGFRKNTPRRDVKIDPAVFLPSIRGHLYLSDTH